MSWSEGYTMFTKAEKAHLQAGWFLLRKDQGVCDTSTSKWNLDVDQQWWAVERMVKLM